MLQKAEASYLLLMITQIASLYWRTFSLPKNK